MLRAAKAFKLWGFDTEDVVARQTGLGHILQGITEMSVDGNSIVTALSRAAIRTLLAASFGPAMNTFDTYLMSALNDTAVALKSEATATDKVKTRHIRLEQVRAMVFNRGEAITRKTLPEAFNLSVSTILLAAATLAIVTLALWRLVLRKVAHKSKWYI
jgi:hypothetical protein